jgi:hypothetical protein
MDGREIVTRGGSWLMLLAATLLASACALSPTASLSPAEPCLPQPRLEVFVAPETAVATGSQKVLLAPLRLSPEQGSDLMPAMTGLMQDILLQHRLFAVLERASLQDVSDEVLLDFGAQRGFDYVMFVGVPPIVPSVGNSRGWLALDIRLVSTRNRVTIWHAYGEAYLLPEPARHSILDPVPFRPAPTVAQGFVAIVRAVADCIGRYGWQG